MSRYIFLVAFLAILPAGCARVTETTSPTQVVSSPTPMPSSVVEPSFTPSPTTSPIPTSTPEPRQLDICISSSVSSLYLYEGDDSSLHSIEEAIYDGPIDHLSYAYQPVILEKLPNLSDGDAVLQPVEVSAGERVVDASGDVTTLQVGVHVFPSGCGSPDCSVTYSGQGSMLMDQLSVSFRLLSDLRWSDSAPLTARDSVYSFNLAAHPDTPANKFVIERTAAYQALDDLTTQWLGLPGFFDHTYFLNFWHPLPEHLWSKYSPAQLLHLEISNYTPLGWGAYMIDEFTPNYLRMVRNPYYFRAAEGLPWFDVLIFRFKGGPAEDNLASLLSGECDVVNQTSELDDGSGQLQELDAQGKLRAVYSTRYVWHFAALALHPAETWQGFSASGAFQDVRLRRAIAMCMDRQQIIDQVFNGHGTVLDTNLSPSNPLYNPMVEKYPFDVQAGSALLDEIGWVDNDGNAATPRVYQGDNAAIPSGTSLEFKYWITTYYNRPAAAEILTQSLAQCGIILHVEVKKAADLFEDAPDGLFFSRQFDMLQTGAWMGDEPDCDLYLNATGYSNPEYDEGCNQARAILPGQPGYLEAQYRVQEIVANDLPVIPLYIYPIVAAIRPDLCGYLTDPTAREMWNIEAFTLEPGCK